MENIKRGDIYWIGKSPYRPEIGSVQAACRPGVIVSNDTNNTYSQTVEIVYLTTKPKTDLPTHCTIRSAPDISTALCEQVTTVSTEQLENYCGTCTQSEMDQIDACIAISLGLDTGGTESAEQSKELEKTKTDLEKMKVEYERLKIAELEAELIKTKAREELFSELYHSLHERMLGK